MKHQLIKGLAALSLGLAATTASAITYDLCVGTTTITMPPNSANPSGEVVPVWGYGLDDTSTNCDTAQVPGPALTVPPGDSLTVNLRNALTGPNAEPVSMVIPGQPANMIPATFVDASGRTRIRSFTIETPVGSTGNYSWTGMQPGTYLYHSGTHVQIQVSMGLYGSLTRDSTQASNAAYANVIYDQQVTLLYSELDPALNNAVASGAYTSCSGGFAACNADLAAGDRPSAINYRPVYHMVNGQPFTSKLQAAHSIGAVPTVGNRSDVLVRFLNAGNQTHVPVIQGGRWRVISENGEPYSFAGNDAKTQHSVTLPAMTTRDVMLSIGDGVANTTQVDTPTAFAVYDRSLAITNAVDEAPGGLISFLMVDVDTDSDGIFNYADNCVLTANPGQEDSDGGTPGMGYLGTGDGYGDVCDADFDGNSFVNFGDITILLGLQGTTGPLGDFDSNGIVNFGDITSLLGMIGQPVGPSCIVPGADPVLCPLQ